MMLRLAKTRVGRLGIALIASFTALLCGGVALASACTWVSDPTPGTTLYVHSAPSESSSQVGSIAAGHEFYGSCTPTNGWITVTAGQWSYTWTGASPYDYVNAAYAYQE